MKLFFLLFLLPLAAHAEKARFTTVFLDDEGVVYVGVKHGDSSEILSIPFKSGERTSIPLPSAITSRDVVGLITEKQKLFVLTTHIGEKDDGPMLHVYDRDKSRWSMVGKVICPVFTKVTLKPTQMIFSCEVGKSRKGKVHVTRKVIALKHDRIFRRGNLLFPEFLLHYKGKTVMLEGEAPNWDTLRLRSEDGERTISADDLGQLPLPGAEASVPARKSAPAPVPDETPLVK
ncbi:MAG: hypothetical protein ACXVB9_10795 [Bdellovibrionota bacterium]